MTLSPGKFLGPHEILAPIGAGGMGEVYRARDTRLNRIVAIKVLPENSSNPEMKQRFEREAQTIAALNHPHICTLFDVGRQDGIDFLVMEYLEGESLAERIARGPLPLDEAVKYAIQIAGALDKAHRQGVVHRDLKPGNIMITKSGAKMLDFGLARLKHPSATPAFTVSTVPTEKSGLTVQGTILGTLQYMSPEQLEGKEADARTDIFAFGTVLYESITGRKAFEGKSHVSLIGAILEREPAPISSLQPASPRAIDVVVKKCLEKDPDERWQSAGDLAASLQWIVQEPSVATSPGSEPIAKSARTSKVWFLLSAALLLTTIAMAAVLIYEHRSPPDAAIMRFSIPAPDKMVFDSGVSSGNNGYTGGSISPNGRKLVFAARDESGRVMLWVRSLDTLEALPLPGTEGAAMPFWAPDSRSIAFFSQAKLKRIDAGGGPALTVCDAANARGGSWGSQGLIVFAAQNPGPLSRVSSDGGAPVAATKFAEGDSNHRFPSFLPDGKHFLFLAVSTSGMSIRVGSVDSLESQRLLAADGSAIYASGYVLFVRQSTLLAQPFDPDKLQLSGDALPIVEQVGTVGPGGAFSASGNGVLGYRTGLNNSSLTLTTVDRTGKPIDSVRASGHYLGPDMSPDGKYMAAHRHDDAGGDVWTVEMANGKASRLTFDASQENTSPLWSPDGDRIVFASRRKGKWGIYQKSSNGTGTDELLTESDLVLAPTSWSADGRIILYAAADPKTAQDIWALPLSGDRKPFPVLQTPFVESHPQISPDGKWFAYFANETNRTEIYVQTFPPGRGKWQISSNGGTFPRWRADGKELFYMSAPNSGKIFSSEINATGSKFEFSAPRALFDSGYINISFGHSSIWNTFAVFSNGQRFLIPRPDADLIGAANTPITVVLNWTAALKK